MSLNHILNRLLTPNERTRWEAALGRNSRDVPKGVDLVREGDRPTALRVVLSGWVAKYRQLPNGRRQIVALCLPGELCDLDLFTVSRTDHATSTLRRATVAELGPAEARGLLATCPHLSQVLCWNQILATSIQREWLTNVGQRSAVERVAHLMCELLVRQHDGRGGDRALPGGACDFFLTQSQIAEATGLTQVHVNRTIQQLRQTHGVELRTLRLEIPDLPALARLAAFDPAYLHLGEADRMGDGAAALFGWSGQDTGEQWLSGQVSRRQLSPVL